MNLTDPRTIEMAEGYLRPLGIVAILNAPILICAKVVGVVCYEHLGKPRDWSIEDQTFAGSIADIAAFPLKAEQWVAMVKRNHESERLESLGVLAGALPMTSIIC